MDSLKESDPSLGYLTRKLKNLPRSIRVRNKTPAPIQITAGQILRQSQQVQIHPPKHNITDPTELADYRHSKRTHFENKIGRNIGVWVKYAHWEESHKDFQRARSIWERLLEFHYKNHSLWIKYAEMEMKNKFINHARNVWDRAVTLLPRVHQLWYNYIHMEEMLGNVAAARQIFERWMNSMPDQQCWLSYIDFELKYNELDRAQQIFDRFLQCHPHVAPSIQYAQFEIKNGEVVEARKLYQKAIANVPPAHDKQLWKRYIYLWINYALYEELDVGDMERTREVYRECLNLIPHRKFSFAKIWILAAQFEIRQLNLKAARQILGNAIGQAPKHKIFKKYIEMELQLGNIDRCRKLYEKYLEWSPENWCAWSKYAELERSLGETDRARAIFEVAIAQPALDMPELLWKGYIDFEIREGEFNKARALYKRLLDRTKHLNVWMSYAEFEAAAINNDNLDEAEALEQKKKCIQSARMVFEEALNYFRLSASDLKEERAMLLEKWLNMEATTFGGLGDVSLVQSKLPKKLKKRRHVSTEDGCTRNEEYMDYLFPDETHTTTLKIMEAAYKWKKQKMSCSDD